jgi:D-alanyl-D-alanine carboxypeptidase/D-alanyl-D-alanine-endopeptidase (penicillin-binding protein 4)
MMNSRKYRSCLIFSLGFWGGLFGLTSSVASAGAAASDNLRLAAELHRVLNGHKQERVVLSAHVVDVAGGQTIFAQDAERSMIPASVMKLVVAAAALERLGADFRFVTRLVVSDRDLVVIGGGDPTLGDEKLCAARRVPTNWVFHAWADLLQKHGISRIPGRLIIDDSIFDSTWTHSDWPADQYEAWYEAPIGGLNYANNCVEVVASPVTSTGEVRLSLVPPNTLIRLVNRARVGETDRLAARRARNADEITVSGTCAKRQRVGPIAVCDPGMYFALTLRTVLASRGIRIEGGTERMNVASAMQAAPDRYRLVAFHESPVADAVLRACRDSQGMMAEGLIKALGMGGAAPSTLEAARPENRGSLEGSWAGGSAAVGDFLESLGVSPSEFVVRDGSGLSRGNRLSARAVTTVLRNMDKHSAREIFVESLAVGGVNGTLSKRLRAPEIRGRIHAKTGYISGVRTLAGYVVTHDGRRLAFAFLYNGASATRPLTQAQDEACRLLATWGARKAHGD